MHVAVEQAGDKITPVSFDDLGFLPNRVIGIFADKGNMPADDGDIGFGDNFPGLNADPLPVFDHQISGSASHGYVDKRLREHLVSDTS